MQLKKIFAVGLGVLAVVGLGYGYTQLSAQNAPLLAIEKAQSIALKDAGLTEAEVKIVKANLDLEDGQKVYEIEFYTENQEYDYHIDAKTGAILEKDFDAENYAAASLSSTTPSSSAPTETQATSPVESQNTASASTATASTPSTIAQLAITLEQAKNFALTDAGVSSTEANFVKAKNDFENGRRIYEIEFYAGNKEYDYKYDAQTGMLIEKDFDMESDLPVAQQASPSTSVVHLDFNAITGRTGTPKVEKDYENGVFVYEVTYYEGRSEYEYKIDAQGKVLAYKEDHD